MFCVGCKLVLLPSSCGLIPASSTERVGVFRIKSPKGFFPRYFVSRVVVGSCSFRAFCGLVLSSEICPPLSPPPLTMEAQLGGNRTAIFFKGLRFPSFEPVSDLEWVADSNSSATTDCSPVWVTVMAAFWTSIFLGLPGPRALVGSTMLG